MCQYAINSSDPAYVENAVNYSEILSPTGKDI